MILAPLCTALITGLVSSGCSFAEETSSTAPPAMAPVPTASTSTRVVNADLIRVGISDNSMVNQEYTQTQISANGPFRAIDTATGNIVFEGDAWESVTVTVDNQGFDVQGRTKKPGLRPSAPVQGPIRFEPANSATLLRIPNITRKGSIPSYRGALEVTRGYSSPKKLSTVNILSLQDYLKAVVPNELPARYGLEAVKAQAVAARNYALRPREKAWPQFDICDSQYCQAYYGAHTETPETTRALAETEGQVALYNGELVLALYSSSHGGWGEAYHNVFSDNATKSFPGTPMAYLTGGADIPSEKFSDLSSENAARTFWTTPFPSYDVDSPHHRWERVWKRSEIERTIEAGLAEVSQDNFTKPFVSPLFKPGQRIGVLKRITVNQRGVSGKAMEITIEASNGTWKVQKEFLIRKVFKQNGRMMPSANVVFSHLTDGSGNLVSLKANGGGFGHGVGMSQLGASWMGKHGYHFPQIIQHYYKGASIGSLPVSPGSAPVKTTFFTRQPQGRLMVKLPTTDGINKPVLKVHVNNTVYAVDTGKTQTLDVGNALHAQQLNTLLLEPMETPEPATLFGITLPTAGTATVKPEQIKVWVELVPAQ